LWRVVEEFCQKYGTEKSNQGVQATP